MVHPDDPVSDALYDSPDPQIIMTEAGPASDSPSIQMDSSPHRMSGGPPDARSVLGWIYLGRVLVATFLVFRLPTIRTSDPLGGLYLTVLVTASIVFTAVSFLASHGRDRRQESTPASSFLYGQVLFDIGVLTGLVYLTGGHQSIFVPLYILAITAGALLLPVFGGVFVGLLASVLYLGAALALVSVPETAILLHALLFAVVAIVTGYIGGRLRQTGAALGAAETELRKLRLDTADVLESIGTGILTVDGHGRLAYINPHGAETLAIEPSEWLDRPILDELDRIAPGLGSVIERTGRTGTPIRRFETQRLEEDSFILGVSTTLVEQGRGERPAVTVIFQDITEKMRVEALRRRADRLEAVAELSASLAHEIKNPLASIRSAVEQLSSDRIDPEDAHVLKALIIRETDRVSGLLGDFIDFARIKIVGPEPVDLVDLAYRVVDVIRSHPDTRNGGVTLTLEAPSHPLQIRGAADLLHHAIFNLTLNAVQWAGVNGSVMLVLQKVRSDLLTPAMGALQLVRLTVRDTGPGVPEEIRETIFDPFFTRRSGGTGLGLALVQRAIEAHGGAIFVDEAPPGNSGAVFSLYLPLIPDDSAPGDDLNTMIPAVEL